MNNYIKDYNNILVNCSGGADSSLMLFELIKTCVDNSYKKDIHVLTLSHSLKQNWNGAVAANVVRFVSNYFNTDLIVKHHIHYVPAPQKDFFDKVQTQIYENYNIDLQMNAKSMAPIKDAVVVIDNKTIDLVETCPVPDRKEGKHSLFDFIEPALYLPYGGLTKDKLAEKYRQYGIIDSLFPITRSCEGWEDVTENFTKPCKNCWWCFERYWAFGKF